MCVCHTEPSSLKIKMRPVRDEACSKLRPTVQRACQAASRVRDPCVLLGLDLSMFVLGQPFYVFPSLSDISALAPPQGVK